MSIVDYIPWIGNLYWFIVLLMNPTQEFLNLQASLAAQIRALRVEVDISQEALALSAEVDRTYVSQLERGIANPSLLILSRIANALGVELQLTFSKCKPKTHKSS